MEKCGEGQRGEGRVLMLERKKGRDEDCGMDEEREGGTEEVAMRHVNEFKRRYKTTHTTTVLHTFLPGRC